MKTQTKRRVSRAGLVAFVAPLLVLGASFANFLNYHRYPLFRAEVLIAFLALGIISVAFAALHARASTLGKAILEAFLVFLAVDLNSDLTLIAAGGAAIAGFLRLGRDLSLLEPLAIVAGIVFASAAVGLSESRPPIVRVVGDQPPASGDRAILHIILDEHGGVGGAPDAAFREALSKFYTDRGFRLFERAYSQHFHTVNAIPDILNFGRPGQSRNVSETLDIGRTAYLSRLEREGYRLNFYQSDFADFCRYSNYASCTSYWSPSLAFIEDAAVSPGQKARLMAFKFAALSSLLQAIAGGIDDLTHLPFVKPLGIPVIAPEERAASGSLGGFAALDRMASDLKSAQPGNVYFAHILAPHYPYVVRGDCAVVPPSRWEYRRSSRAVAVRRAAYQQQVGCLMRHVDKVVAAFLASPASRDAVVIIHGDHGTRITGMDPVEPNKGKLTPADLMAAYSTLFAVRAPEIAPGVEERPAASADILEHLAKAGFSSVDAVPPGNGEVHLDGPNWTIGERTSIANAWPDSN